MKAKSLRDQPRHRRASNAFRLVCVLVIVGVLPLDWAEGVNCSGLSFRATGFQLYMGKASFAAFCFVALVLPVLFGVLGARTRRPGVRFTYDLAATLAAGVSTFFVAVVPSGLFSDFRLLAAGWAALGVNAALTLESLLRVGESVIRGIHRFRARRRGDPY